MSLDERIVWSLIGCFIGFVLGYIVRILQDIKEELDEVDDIVKDNVHKRDELGAVSWDFVSRVALFLVVVLVAYSAFVSQRASNDVKANVENDLVERCKAGVDTRTVQRDTVDAVYNLAKGLTVRKKNDPPMTAKQRAATRQFLHRLDSFRNDMYGKIHPSQQCMPYVHDDNVKPRKSPSPHIA